LKVCNSRICWHRIAFYISNCSVFYPELTLDKILNSLIYRTLFYTEIAQRIFKYSDIQYTGLTPDKILNSLIWRMLVHVNIYGSYNLLKTVRFCLAHPVQFINSIHEVIIFTVCHGEHPLSQHASQSLPKTRKTQKSRRYLQHLPICYSMCCGPICRRCCGKRQMSMDDRMNRTTSPTSGGSSAMAFMFL